VIAQATTLEADDGGAAGGPLDLTAVDSVRTGWLTDPPRRLGAWDRPARWIAD